MNNDYQFVEYMHTPIGLLQVCARNLTLTGVDFVSVQQHQPKPNDITQQAIVQLEEYFSGQRKIFDLPLQLEGTDFQKRVWLQLCDVEYGQTCSYADIASKIDNPKAVRAVGAANGRNKIAIVIPCHRIIGANGTLTGYAGGLDRKSYLLTLEQENAHR